MNGKQAKRLRRKVYGDMSIRAPRVYSVCASTGQVVNHPESLRARYQRAKKEGKR